MKGVTISSQVAIFAVSAMLASAIFGVAFNILDNNVIEQRLMDYRTEELATSIGLVTHYGKNNSVSFEKTFKREYQFDFEDNGGKENLTVSKTKGPPRTSSTTVPTVIDLPTKSVTGRTICIEKTRDTSSSPEEVNINSGSC